MRLLNVLFLYLVLAINWGSLPVGSLKIATSLAGGVKPPTKIVAVVR